jgi:hypothetical protein
MAIIEHARLLSGKTVNPEPAIPYVVIADSGVTIPSTKLIPRAKNAAETRAASPNPA